MTNFSVKFLIEKFCAMGTKPLGQVVETMGPASTAVETSIDDDKSDECRDKTTTTTVHSTL